MRINPFICAALVTVLMPTVALADDPNDATMRNPAARARDREMTRQLNLVEKARVRQRDAHADDSDAAGEYAARSRDHKRAVANYARRRAQYERDMTEWRRAVAACRAGNYSACDN